MRLFAKMLALVAPIFAIAFGLYMGSVEGAALGVVALGFAIAAWMVS